MGRWVGIDYGRKRIGLALADPRGRIASPAGTLPGRDDPRRDAAGLLEWAARNDAAGIVVGLPLNMDGSDSEQTRLTRILIDELRRASSLPVEPWDERLTSFQAEQWLAQGDVRASRRKVLRDTLAAVAILQSFLDARLGTDEPAQS